MTKSQKKFWSLIKKFRFNSIFFLYLKYILIFLSIPFVLITIFISYNTYLNAKTDIEEKSHNISERSCYIFEDVFNHIGKLYYQFANDNETLNLITTDTSNIDSLKLNKMVSGFYDQVHNVISNSDIIDSIYLYSKRNSYVYSTDSSNTLNNFLNIDWYNEYISNNKKNTVCNTKIDDEDVISVVMNIYSESEHSGILVFNISKNYIDSAINDFENLDISYSAFLTSNKKIAYSLNENDFEKAQNDSIFSYSYDIIGHPVSYTGFFSCNISIITLKQILPIAIPYFIFIITSIIFVAFLCSLKFYSSISDIMSMFEIMAHDTDIPFEKYNEIHYISDNILNILLHSKQVENDLTIHFSKFKKAQSIALQTQINPHFLFNTLNLVNTIIIEDCGKDTDAVSVINTLSKLISFSLDTQNYIVSVEEEINYAKQYIDIELIKSDYSFIVDWNISPDVLQYKTLKMILQPILENAVFHGVGNIESDKIGKITVDSYLENNNLIFSITDNGKGISEDTLSQITYKLNSNEIIETRHIGIVNVNSRIKLIYGEEYGCSIITSSNGTTISIKQPIAEIN